MHNCEVPDNAPKRAIAAACAAPSGICGPSLGPRFRKTANGIGSPGKDLEGAKKSIAKADAWTTTNRGNWAGASCSSLTG